MLFRSVLDDGAEVTIKPGFLLDGGQIEVRKAQLHLHGTAAQPVVFRHVVLTQQNGGFIDADNAVFIDCTFKKASHDPARFHATKWIFSNCLIYRTQFAGLKQADYGVRVNNCAFVECVLPDRETQGSDLASAFGGKWDQVVSCFFFRTRLTPSVVWLTSKCNFIRCPVTGANEFKSKTSVAEALFTPDSDPMINALRTNTLVSDVGDLRYGFVRKPYDIPLPAFWSLLPTELPDTAKDHKESTSAPK